MTHQWLSVVALCLGGLAGCGSSGGASGDAGGGGPSDAGGSASNDVYSSEVAIDAVSGALNTEHGADVAWLPAPEPRGVLARVLDELKPVRSAYAAGWTCTGGGLMPRFAGPGGYAWMPPSCSVTIDGETGSSSWSGAFSLVYGSGCDAAHAWIDRQSAACVLTRTTSAGGNTRTITTVNGTTRTVTHDTNGAATGWDPSVAPAPSSNGVVISCGPGGCASSRTITISGSHLTGTVVRAGGMTRFDHTIATGTGGLSVIGADTSRTVSGTVIVQHNLTKNTATVTLTGVTYGDAGCPFPTAGTVTATFTNGPKTGTAETMTFTGQRCGDASISVAGTTTSTELTAPI